MEDFVQYVNAGNDRNGNPRRGWIHYRCVIEGTWFCDGFYEEGFEGVDALPKHIRQLGADTGTCMLPTLFITPAQYRELKGRKRAKVMHGEEIVTL